MSGIVQACSGQGRLIWADLLRSQQGVCCGLPGADSECFGFRDQTTRSVAAFLLSRLLSSSCVATQLPSLFTVYSAAQAECNRALRPIVWRQDGLSCTRMLTLSPGGFRETVTSVWMEADLHGKKKKKEASSCSQTCCCLTSCDLCRTSSQTVSLVFVCCTQSSDTEEHLSPPAMTTISVWIYSVFLQACHACIIIVAIMEKKKKQPY